MSLLIIALVFPFFLLNKNIYWVFLWTCLFCSFFSFDENKFISRSRWTFSWKLHELYFSIFCYGVCWRKPIIWAGEKCQTPTPFGIYGVKLLLNRKLDIFKNLEWKSIRNIGHNAKCNYVVQIANIYKVWSTARKL